MADKGTEKTTGILGSQSRVRDEATKSRSGKKNIMMKFFVPILIIAMVAIPALWWWKGHSSDDPGVASAPQTAPQPTQGTTVPQRPGDAPVTIMVGKEWSQPIAARIHGCFRWYGKDPSAKAFEVQVRGPRDNDSWYTWETYKSLKEAGKAPFKHPGWFRFRSTTDAEAEVNYELGKRSDCS